jgi:signal transduction histidine kinase/DNA-binding response OmpR family regulator
MTKNPLAKLGAGLDRLLYYPGCDQKTLFGHKSVWMSTAYAFVHSFILTLFFLVFTPQLTILIQYGYSLVVMFTITLTLFLVFPRQFMIIGPLQGWTFNLITFFYIIKLGGIPTSGGLIFVGITTALATIPLQIVWYSVMMFSVYIVLVVLMVALKPWMTVPEQMTPALNSLVFMINTMSMTGASFYFVLNFFKQQRRIDDMEANRLKEINEAKNRLFTNITHEFRTPLTVIEGMSDLIEKKPDEWLKEGTSMIRSNSRVLLKLVNQMLDMAKIESGVMSLNFVQSDICTYTGYVTELFTSVAQTRGITLTCRKAPDLFIMDFDPDKLLQIVSNLVSNALKFTGEGGRVEVSVQPDEKGSYFIIKVADSGIGISPEQLPHIFERFYQADNVTGFQQGTGLGLAHARELVQVMNGQISVESRQGTGTTFTLCLPVTRTAPVVDFAGSVKDREEAGTYIPGSADYEYSSDEIEASGSELPLMLIVEDSEDVSRYLAAILKNKYRIEHAGNGMKGFEKALNQIPDIILSDVMMPEMDGIELLEKVKSDIRTSHIPVVILTAKADVISRLEGLEKGADAYLAKPFDDRELHIVLKNLLQIRRKLHERYSTVTGQHESDGNEYRLEDAFMTRVRLSLEAHLDDDEFGISELCSDLGVSRAQLYRKFKSLSNKTIVAYLKELRIDRAKSLLVTTAMSISDVAIVTGFRSLSYFSREFSAESGISPIEFRKMNNLRPTVKKQIL